jgi:hypothetical protein
MMIRTICILTVLTATAMTAAAETSLDRCKAMTDSTKRLQCYDELKSDQATTPAKPAQPAQPAKPAQPAQPAAAAGEDPMIAKAKAAVQGELRAPDSAKFTDVKLRQVDGKPAVCGLVNANNSRGKMTGPQPFAYDGEHMYLIIYNPGPANSSKESASALGEAMGNRLKNYNRLCH